MPILVFLIFAAILYGLIPFLSKTLALSNDLKEQTANLQQIKDYFASLQNITFQINQNQEIFANIEKALPGEFSAPSLLGFFQTTAAESGLLLRDFDYEEAVSNQAGNQEGNDGQKIILSSKVKPAVFNLTMKGSLASFLSFIKSLEVSSRLLEVSSIDFQIDKTKTNIDKIDNSQIENDQANDDMIEFNISIKIHSY